jgi:hypothetical protein
MFHVDPVVAEGSSTEFTADLHHTRLIKYLVYLFALQAT